MLVLDPNANNITVKLGVPHSDGCHILGGEKNIALVGVIKDIRLQMRETIIKRSLDNLNAKANDLATAVWDEMVTHYTGIFAFF